jgi:hypothetical protein
MSHEVSRMISENRGEGTFATGAQRPDKIPIPSLVSQRQILWDEQIWLLAGVLSEIRRSLQRLMP